MNAPRRWLALTLLACTALAAARAQEPTPPPQEEAPKPVRLTPPMSAQQAAEQEMKELFLKVETRLREIDRLLSDAGAGDTKALGEDLDSGMNELLERTQESGNEVLKDIDRILELAAQMGNQSGGGGGKQSGDEQQQPGESPLDKQRGQSSQREQTPSSPEQGTEQNGQQPQQQQSGEQDPRDNRGSQDKSSRNTPGQTPPASATEGPSRTPNDADRWGDLPVHARDIFRVEGGGDMPVQYRDWIDSYYRRLNTKNP